MVFIGWERLLALIDVGRVAGYVGAVLVLWAVAGCLKRGGWLRAGDARKLNHVCALAGGAFCFGWLPHNQGRVSFFVAGLILFAFLLLACSLRRRPLFAMIFHGYARETEAPGAAGQIWLPWLAAAYGLGLVDALFADWTITRTAALLLGFADGIAEPVGSRFGRHRFAVLDPLFGGQRTRSLEGSLAVFLTSLVVMLCCANAPLSISLFGAASLAALGVAFCEAVTPHGLDNFTIPVAGGILMRLIGIVPGGVDYLLPAWGIE
jgi:phytol kinase